MEIDLLAGENFPADISSENEKYILLNELATQRMGYDTPDKAIGEVVQFDSLSLTVIGVTKDFYHAQIYFDQIEPFGLRHNADYATTMNIRLSEVNTPQTVEAIENVWNELAPKESMSSFFTDERAYHLTKFFRMGSKIIGFIGFLTILISCMGLLGMVIYTIEGKLKEIGVRKVLGASESSLNWQLAKSFLKLLGLAIFLAVPLTVVLLNLWLQNFTMRINIGFGLVFFSIAIMLTLALTTLFSQTFFAARTNPVDILQDE